MPGNGLLQFPAALGGGGRASAPPPAWLSTSRSSLAQVEKGKFSAGMWLVTRSANQRSCGVPAQAGRGLAGGRAVEAVLGQPLHKKPRLGREKR